MWEVSWQSDGRKLLLNVLILPPAMRDIRTISATALIDTGATTSAVTAEIAAALDLPVVGKRNIASAHADQMVERYLFRVGMDLSGQDGPNFPFVFDAVEGFRIRAGFTFDVIVGMDILRQCDLSIEKGTSCTLRFG